MNKQEIIFKMEPDGTRTLEAQGFIGKACEKATAKMVKELGKVDKQSKKPVYHQSEKQKDAESNW